MDAKTSPPRRVLVGRIESRQWLETLPGEAVAIRVRSADVGGAYAVLEVVAAPGYGVPLHIHSNEDEIFHIIDGEIRFRCEKTELDALPGTSVVVPRGTAHAWRNFAPLPMRMLVTFTPGGLDQLFEEIVGRSLVEIDALAQRYGTFIVGPTIGD
jgi:mannose-6-phosphate isomerase-like protein (cupin superfamily)